MNIVALVSGFTINCDLFKQMIDSKEKGSEEVLHRSSVKVK